MPIAKHKTHKRELREGRVLARKVRRGDRGAFELLYASYEGRLYRLCHRLTGSDAASAALVEATFVRAIATLPEAGLDALDLPGHLAATARTLVSERHSNGGRPWLDPIRGEHAGEVGAANQRLAPRQRMVLALRDLEGRPDDEIAHALGADTATVDALVARARQRLRAELQLTGSMDGCRERVAELSAYADGALAAERRADLESHLVACAGCRAGLFALQEAALRYRDLPVPVPPGELRSRIAIALGAVGLPAHAPRALVPDPSPESGGIPRAAAFAMAGIVVLGAVVTFAIPRDLWASGAPAQPAPRVVHAVAGQPAVAASEGSRAFAAIAPPPPLHRLRARPRGSAAHTVPAHRRLPPPNAATPDFLSSQTSARTSAPPPPAPPPPAPAPHAPGARSAKPSRRIPVQILPPVTPVHSPATADVPPPPPAQDPSDPAQTTST